MENRLFRQSNMDRIASPEQLDDYMRVTNPGIWMVLGAVIVLLIGLFAAAISGRIENTLDVTAKVEDGVATIIEVGDDARALEDDMTMRIGSIETTIDTVRWLDSEAVEATAPVDLPDGIYKVVVVTEVISPISFLSN